jgi:Family of unknown function (DUF6056)
VAQIKRSHRFARLVQVLIILGCLGFAIPLIGYMINGSAMRFSGDDYCYADVLSKLGFWRTQWVSYLQPQAYSGNRYSLTFFSSLSGIFGPVMNGALPALVIIAWLVSMAYTIRNIARMAGISTRLIEILLAAEIIIFFTLYTAPSLSQILYWRSGMLPYLAPLIANTVIIGLVINLAQRKKVTIWGFGLIGIMALLGGGFSEAAAVVQLGYLTLALLALYFLVNKKFEWKRNATQVAMVAWGFSLVACLLLAIAPANKEYMSRMSRPDILSFLTISLKSGLSFIYGSIISQPLPNIILLMLSLGAFWLIFSIPGISLQYSPRRWLRDIIIAVIAATALIIASTAPSAYIQSAYPELRALILARFVMILLIMSLGSLSGLLLSKFTDRNSDRFELHRLAVVVILGVFCLYPIYTARNIYNQIPSYQRWSSYWDQRDQVIREAKQNNILDVEVMKIDHIIPSVAELSEDPNYWYNICASGYYGVNTIRADKPGWDNP